MKLTSIIRTLCAMMLFFLSVNAKSTNNLTIPSISESDLVYYLNNPVLANAARYDIKDNAGNAMQSPSIIQMTNQAHRYAAVYHTPYKVSGGYRYRVNLSVSDDLINWTYQGILIENADMPKISQVAGSDWLVVTHEQWMGATLASTAPAQVGYKLFYNFSDLVSRTVRSSWLAPQFQNKLNGTPSIYEFHLVKYGNNYSVDGQYGFHYWNGSRDVNAVTTISRLFDPVGGTFTNPSSADAYNNLFRSNGVSGNLGQRDTLITTSARFNIQEGNIGQPAQSWDKWRIWLYKFGDNLNYPTANGTISMMSPKTVKGSTSFGNPSVGIVDEPGGYGKVIVVSYFVFSEGAAPGEAGTLLYYFRLK